jgi:rhamnosyltransferase
MDVSIVIRTKNEAEFIKETLKKVEEQEFSGKYEIIVVDSGSTDSTLDIIKKYKLRLIRILEKEFTYGRSLNIGAMNAEGAFIVNLSAHALPRDNKWLTNLVAGFEDPKVAGVYGRQISIGHSNPFEALQNDLFFGQRRITFSIENKKTLKQIHFTNSNSAIRKNVWQKFKFDEHVPYAEDVLWQTEVMGAGFSIVYSPDAAVYHTHGMSIYNAYKTSRDCAYSLALMKKKRQSILLGLYDVGLCVGLVPNSIFKNVKYLWQNNYVEHLKIVPFYVISEWLGWLVGRTKYRLRR